MPTTIRMTRLPRPVQIASAVIAAVLLNSELASGQTITLINPGTDDRIQSITNLDIAGTTYDITFQHGRSFNDLSGTQITFNTQADALTAFTAIDDFIDGTGTNHGPLFTEAILVPYNTDVDYVISGTPGDGVLSYANTPVTIEDFDPTEDVQFTAAYLTFTPLASTAAVPEPTTFALAGTLSLGAIAYRRRRNRISANSKTNP